jgi:hypothetical protein
MTRSERLRELAAWYRDFAEKTENPQIWAARLRQAEVFEAEALAISREPGPEPDQNAPET